MVKMCFPRKISLWCFLMIIGLACLGTGSACWGNKMVIQKQQLHFLMNLMTISLKNCSLHELVSLIAHQTQNDYIISTGARGQVSANLRNVDGT